MRRDYKEEATTILNDAASYKLCVVCGAIVDKEADSCPDCLAYRFDINPEHVMNQALELGANGSQAISHLDTME